MTTIAASPTNIGILCAIGAATAFSLNDMAIKFLSGDYPLHQIVFVRASIGLIITLVVFAQLEGGVKLRTKWPLHHAIRAGLLVTANILFFTSIATMPLADATAIFFVSPLLITGMSVIFLKEVVGPRRWICVFIGLIGVVIIVGPGRESFQIASILPALAALCYGATHMMTRRLRGTESAATMAIYIQVAFVIFAGGFGLIAGDGSFLTTDHPSLVFLLSAWTWPPTADFAVMAATGVASATGGYLITQAYRLSEAGLVAPFEYLALIFAIFWGYTIWGEVPTAVVAAGMTLVLGSGVYLAVREAKLGARPSAKQAGGRR